MAIKKVIQLLKK